MKKNIVNLLIALLMALTLSITVLAKDVEMRDEINVDNYIPTDEFSADVTLRNIENSIIQYLNKLGLQIDVGTEKYYEQINLFLTDPDSFRDVSNSTLRYYRAYASTYMSRISNCEERLSEDDLAKTIKNIKDENIARETELKNNIPEIQAYASYNSVYHVSFVQSKVNGYIYLTQHTSDYYNLKFNDRVPESQLQGGDSIVVIDFTK